MSKRDFIVFEDWNVAELRELVALARDLKSGRARGSLEGKIVALYFMNPSLRTRASTESACARLGAKAITLDAGAGGVWGLEHRDGVKMDGQAAEHIREAAPVLARYADALCVRAFPKLEKWAEDRSEPVLRAFARSSPKPVVSLEGSSRHPLQGLADATTLAEKGKRGDKVVVSWAPHPKPLPMCVTSSALEAGALAGMDVVLAHPPGWELDPQTIASAEKIARETGGRVSVTHDQEDALRGARFVYAKSWGALSCYGEWPREAELRKKHDRWMIDLARLGQASFMHCLPTRRDVEIAAEVLDSPRSIVVDQAENRLWTVMAVLLSVLDGHVTRDDAAPRGELLA
ncbi:MAG TPA: N-acetylornithine carbamoyltransferase [Planctomycetota bacterium]|nr:N-acetylornithine carbamoyltransferase [Planctomycetota bacterium]